MSKLRRLSLVALMAGTALAAPVAAQAPTPATAPVEAPAAARDQRPNILVWMMDDVGFGQVGSFGGLVETPNIDRVARIGLRYDNYRTAPMCSPARASFLSGRMPHSVHMGGHALQSFPFPGYDAKIPPEAGSIAENLHQAGYTTFAVGKWDHFPGPEASGAGPFHHWPLGQGFDRFYGFLAAQTDNFDPTLVRDNTPIARPHTPDYHLSTDMADQAIEMIRNRTVAQGDLPFFMYWATGVAHAPHHAPQAWLDHYRGKFDMGWDKAREQILRKQIATGIVPKGTKLAPRPQGLPAWDSLSADQKRLYARQMEAFAAALSHADQQFGRILDDLETRGELANTIVMVTSDNGASAEGGPDGLLTEAYIGNETPVKFEENMALIDKWGRAETHPHYSYGWAVAGNTPHRYYKQTAHEGGIRVPLVIAWPKGIAAHGALRNQAVHVSDIAPTLLAMTGVEPAAVVNNVRQSPMEGQSFAATFGAEGDRREGRPQYSELWGNKSLWQDGWSIVTSHRLQTWESAQNAGQSFDDPWELYDVARDPGQTTDLAAKYPDRVAAMSKLWHQQAQRFNVLPQHNVGENTAELTQAFVANLRARNGKWRYMGPVDNIPFGLAPPVNMMPFTVTAKLNLPRGDETGPVFAYGGQLPGMGLFLDRGKPVFLFNAINGEKFRFAGKDALPAGSADIAVKLAKGKVDGENRADWTVTMQANGKPVAQGVMHIEMPRIMGISATFEIGNDMGGPVMEEYPSGQPLPARIEDVTFDFFAR